PARPPPKVASARADVPGAEDLTALLIERRTRIRRPAAFLASLWAVAVLALLNVTPVGAATAAGGPTKLVNPDVTPRSGTTSTTIVFEVGYRNREGSPPDHVDVIIDGVAHAMAATGTS